MKTRSTPDTLHPTILVTGASGQLGNKITQLLAPHYQLILTDSLEMDITDKSKVRKVIKLSSPDLIIHGAAYTKVDLAEEEKELCSKINVLGTKNLAKVAGENKIPVIYISTDFVFDGKKKKPYIEIDKANPLSVYGQTKYEGEQYIKKYNRNYIVRVSWLFGELPRGYQGSNFVETMIKLGKTRDNLKVVDDQIGSPTYTHDLVILIKKLIEDKPEGGIYHFSGENPCSWYDFAKKIFELTRQKINLEPIASDQYPQKAMRPKYSYLNKQKVKELLGISVRSWEEMLSDYISKRIV